MDKSKETKPSKRRDRAVGRVAKWVAWTLGGIVALVILALTATVWYLSPQRLTSLIERYGSDNFDADVRVEHAEMTFWKSFPRLRLEVRGLEVVSRSLSTLDEAERGLLPADADSLLSIGSFEGSVNVLKAIGGRIALSNVVIDRPRVNLLQVNDSVSNFNIFPQSEPDTTKLSLPEISINRFAITNARPFTYRAPSDSIDISVKLNTISLTDTIAPLYELVVDTRITTPLLEQINHRSVQINLDGGLGWNAKTPYRLKVNDLHVGIEGIHMLVSTDVDFENELTVNTLTFDIDNLDINRVLSLAPVEYADYVKPLDTDMTLSLHAELWQPMVLGGESTWPSMDARLTIPPCALTYQQARFNSFTTDIAAHIDGSRPDLSTIDIKKLIIDGEAVDASVKALVSNLASDPRVRGTFTGSIDFSELPPMVKKIIDGDFSGSLRADTEYALNMSDLTPNRFHRIYLKGDVSLDNFSYATSDNSTGAFANRTRLTFNSNDTFKHGNILADSILRLKLTADTASFFTYGIEGSMRGMTANIAAENNHNTADTTIISPIGASLMIERLTYNSLEDSVKLVLSNSLGIASLQRYGDGKKSPLLGLNLKIGRARIRDSHTYTMGLRESSISATAHLRGPGRPRSAADSVARRQRRAGRLTNEQLDSMGVGRLDFAVNNSVKALLLRWNVKGEVKASSGVARLSAIHLRNRFKDFDLTFTTDSIVLRNLDYRLGGSDFKIDGKVNNVRRALTSSHSGQPLRFDFNIYSDTINLNEVVRALSNPATRTVDGVESDVKVWGEDAFDDLKDPDEVTDSVYGPLLVPVNIDAGLNMRANRIIYGDLLLSDFVGQLFVYDGSVNLSNLSARTDLGSIDLSAIYTAPRADDISFGMGMKLRDIQINKLPNVIPASDSILPMLRGLGGVVNAQLAVTTELTPDMYFKIPTMKAAMKFEGDSLVVFDGDTYRKIAKWLLFKHKDHNMIDHLSVEVVVDDGVINIYPFILDVDRYRLGVMGTTNLDMGYNYHISVLKSPIPFKFGINIKGRDDKMKIRFGGAKFKNDMMAERDSIASSTRINLLSEIQSAFRRGIKASRLGPLDIKGARDNSYMDSPEEAISHADSVLMINEGLIEVPDSVKALLNAPPASEPAKAAKQSKKKKK